MELGHNTEDMGLIISDMQKYDESYNALVDKLYKVIDELTSADFTGGLSKELLNNVNGIRGFFNDFSVAFNEFNATMKASKMNIASNTQYLSNEYQRRNPYA